MYKLKIKLLVATFFVAMHLQLSAEVKRGLIVVTNVSSLSTGEDTGYWMSEVSHAWAIFQDAGIAVDFASPKGGAVRLDPRSFDLKDTDNKELWQATEVMAQLFNTASLQSVTPGKYQFIYFAGGHGTMLDFPSAPGLNEVVGDIWSRGGLVAAVCHGPAALVDLRLPDGSFLVEGKQVAAFTNAEESAVGLTEQMPFLLEDRLRSLGAEMVKAADFDANVVVSGQLITGQNPASAKGVAEALVKLMEE